VTSVVTVYYLVSNYCISFRSRAVADHSGLLVQVTVCDYEYDDYFIPDGCKNCGLHYCQRDHAELHFYCILWRKYVHGVASMTERLCWLTWLCWDGWSSLSCAVISWTECLFASGRNKSFVSVHIANFVMLATVLKWHCTHTHTRLTAFFPGLPRLAGTRKVKPIWILLKQETVSGSIIYWATCKSASRSRQITTPAPHHSVFYRPDALPAAQPTESKHWRDWKGNDIVVLCIMHDDVVSVILLFQTWFIIRQVLTTKLRFIISISVIS